MVLTVVDKDRIEIANQQQTRRLLYIIDSSVSLILVVPDFINGFFAIS